MNSKVDLETISQTEIVRIPVDTAATIVTGVDSLDTNEALIKGIAFAVEEVQQGRSEVEYVVIAIGKATTIGTSSDETASTETERG